MDNAEIISRFLSSNINVHPLALEKLKKMDELEIEKIISEVAKKGHLNVVTPEYLELVKKESTDIQAKEKTQKEVVVQRGKRKALAEEYEAEIRVKDERDVTKKSFSEGNIECFFKYFNDRYERLARILRQRDQLRDPMPIERVKNSKSGEIKIIGMVSDTRASKKGNLIIELEDPTGTIAVLVNKDGELLQASRLIVKDEVIGILGKMWNDMVIANEIFFPDIPITKATNKSEVPLALAMISDIHVGSTKFLEDVFVKFIKWLNGEFGTIKQTDLAERVKYLIIGGDLVDGVGIYPGQENELLEKDIIKQYAKFASFLEELPDYIEIVVVPGNHDAARQAEPQPAIIQEFAPTLYENPKIRMAGNPCSTTLHGVEVLTYHGRSLDDVISTLPEQSYTKPEKAMLELIKKRHLSPIYGGKVPLAPEVSDYMVIDEPPDILHVGHVHHYGQVQYRGVTIINSGTFQGQTTLQKKLNMIPTPGEVPIIDLHEHKTTRMVFI